MRIKYYITGIITIVFIFGGILIANVAGLYNTFRSSEPVKLESGLYDPADIRGSHTLGEIEDFFKVPVEILAEAFNIKVASSNDSEEAIDVNSKEYLDKLKKLQIKELKEQYVEVELNGEPFQMETASVRVFVALYSGLQYESTETAYLPKKALELLKDKLTDEQYKYWLDRSYSFTELGYSSLSESSDNSGDNEEVQSGEKQADSGFTVAGSTTFSQIIDNGMDDSKFFNITGYHFPDDKSITIKAFCEEKSVEFKTVKDKLNSYFSSL